MLLKFNILIPDYSAVLRAIFGRGARQTFTTHAPNHVRIKRLEFTVHSVQTGLRQFYLRIFALFCAI